MRLKVGFYEMPIAYEHPLILICLCPSVQNHGIRFEGLFVVHRCSCQRNGTGFKDAGTGCQRSGSQHQRASGGSCNAGLGPVRHGGLGHADPWSPSGSGSSRRCRESAEAGTGSGDICVTLFLSPHLPFSLSLLRCKHFICNNHPLWTFLFFVPSVPAWYCPVRSVRVKLFLLPQPSWGINIYLYQQSELVTGITAQYHAHHLHWRCFFSPQCHHQAPCAVNCYSD